MNSPSPPSPPATAAPPTAEALQRVGEAALLASTWQVGLLTALLQAPPRTAEALASELDLEPRACRLALDGLAALRFADLTPGGTWAPGPLLAALGSLPLPPERVGALWASLPGFLATGRSARAWGGSASERAETYAGVVSQLAAWSEVPARQLARVLPPAARVLDLGAGSAVWSLAMAAEHPGTRVWAVDLPEVLEVAADRAAAAGLGITPVPGDLLTVPLPTVDRVVLANVLHLYDEAGARRVLRRAREALAPGGELVIVEVGCAEPSPARDPALALYALHLAMRVPDGRVWPAHELEALLGELGLEPEQRLPLTGGAEPLVALVARATARGPARAP